MFRCCRRAEAVAAIASGPIVEDGTVHDLNVARFSTVGVPGISGGETPAAFASPLSRRPSRVSIAELKHAVVLAHASRMDLKIRERRYVKGFIHSLLVSAETPSAEWADPEFFMNKIREAMGATAAADISHFDFEANLGCRAGTVTPSLIHALEQCLSPRTEFTALVRVTLYSGSDLRPELQRLFDASHLSDEALSKIVYFEKGKEQDAQAFRRSVALDEKPRPAVALLRLRLDVHSVYSVARVMGSTPVVVEVGTPGDGGTPRGSRRGSARVMPSPLA